MKRICTAAAVVSLYTLLPVQAQTIKDITGCWRLDTLVADRAGEKTEPFGPKPLGQFMYTEDGHISVVQMRPDVAPNSSAEPSERIVTSYVAYFGTYDIRDKDIVIKVEGSTRSDWRDRTLKRTIETLTATQLKFVDHPEKDLSVTVTAHRCTAS